MHDASFGSFDNLLSALVHNLRQTEAGARFVPYRADSVPSRPPAVRRQVHHVPGRPILEPADVYLCQPTAWGVDPEEALPAPRPATPRPFRVYD